MDDVQFDELEFTFGWCAICDRDVLTYPDREASDLLPRHCVHCDQAVGHHVRVGHGGELPAHGYGLLETQGCGNPSCGGGQCGRRQADQ